MLLLLVLYVYSSLSSTTPAYIHACEVVTSSEACAVAFAYNAKYVIRNRLIGLFIWSNEVEPASHYRLLHIILHKRAIEELTHTRRIDLIHIERGLSKSNILYFRLICWPPGDKDYFYLKFVLVCIRQFNGT